MPVSVAAWLQELDLLRFKAAFELQSVGVDALRFLTDAHLREMRIPIGPRVTMLAAIARLQADSVPVDSVERRRLTVMFADLVGSTHLAAQLDPEDLREVIRAFHRTIDSVVEPHHGFVAQYQGDGALVYFGYPRAHEDDAEVAVRAGLSIVRSVAMLKTSGGVPLAAHVGIATGLTVVGDTFGVAMGRERSAIGETPNLAARLVDLARSREVIVSRQTQQLTRHQFEFEELDPISLKGIEEPQRTFRVLSEKRSETSFDARQSGMPLKMVGRAGELGFLLQRWGRSVSGQGQVVLLSGEAGIGKSRLVRALGEAITEERHVRVSHQCAPHHVGSALFPISRQIARAADLRADDSAETQLAKLQSTWRGGSAADVALIAALLEIDAKPLGTPLDMNPDEQRRQTFQALINYLEGLARERPMLWLLEDVHWIDPTSLEFVQMCIERIATLPILAIITYRPEFEPAFLAAEHVGAIGLSRLTTDEVITMVYRIGGGKRVPDSVASQIASRTDGVPLFVEELTKSLFESGDLVEVDNAYVVQGALDRLAVPASLHDSLMARLDRHRMQREVAQIASCIGREFSHDLLEHVADMPADVLRSALSQLEDAELVFPHGTGVDRRYVFKHALLRDAAYESLLKRRREEMHARILDLLAASSDCPAEVLAHHALGAGQPWRAIELWVRAGKVSLSRSAFAETVSHLTKALQVNTTLPDDRRTQEQRVDLLLTLGQATIPLRGYSHSSTAGIFTDAQNLAHALGDRQRAFWASYSRWVVCYVRGEHTVAHGIASDMFEHASQEGNEGQLLTALRARGISEMISGAPVIADATFARADALADRVRAQPRDRRMAVAQRFAADPEIANQFHVALTHWALGRTQRAREMTNAAVDAARSMGHVHTLGHALTHAAIVAVVDNDPHAAMDCCEEGAEVASRHGMDLWRGYGEALHGFALAESADFEKSVLLLHSGLALLARTETRTMVPLYRAVFAWALAKLGRLAEAAEQERLLALELSEDSQRYWRTETLIWLARYSLLKPEGGASVAEDVTRQALEVAHVQGAVGWELRAATALGSLWLARGERAKARDVISTVMTRFPQAAESTLIREAVALIDSAHD